MLIVYIAAAVAGLTGGLLIGGTIGAVILRAAARWAAKLDVPFRRAFAVVLLLALFKGIMGGLVALAHVVGAISLTLAVAIGAPIDFAVHWIVVEIMLDAGLGRSALITLLHYVLTAAVLAGGAAFGVLITRLAGTY